MLAALPETWLTAWGSLVEGMHVQAGQTLLVRGGTSSVGMAAASLAKARSVRVLATTRDAAKRDALGIDVLLELIGPVTLLDSLRAVRARGIVCHTGLLGTVWIVDRFEPLEDIPSTVWLTTCHGGITSAGRSTAALQEIVDGVAAGRYRPSVERVFRLEEIVAAHGYMDANRGSGKTGLGGPPAMTPPRSQAHCVALALDTTARSRYASDDPSAGGLRTSRSATRST